MSADRKIPLLLSALLIAACAPAAPQVTASAGASGGSPPAAATGSASEEPIPSVSLAPLPEAAAAPTGTPDEIARSLAAAVRAQGPDATAQVVRAFLASGVPVLDDAGSPVAGSPNGMAITAWEVTLLSELHATERGGMLLSDLGETLTALDPALEGAPLAQMMLADLKTAAADPDPGVSTWAQLIAALSAARGDPDPLTATDPDSVALDGLQLQLVTRRLATEMLLESTAATSGVSTVGMIQVPAVGPSRSADAAAPCTYSKSEDLIVTGGEEVTTRGWKEILKYAKDKGVAGADKYAKALKVAGILADLSKFLMAYLLLKAEFELEGGPPLIRTKKERPQTGERRQLVVTVSYDMGNAQAVNCFRLAFANLGMRFSVPKDGPLAGAPMSWQGIKGFDARTDRIVQFYGGDIAHAETDEQGKARIGIEGFGQELTIPEGATPVKKSATVWVLVQMKKNSLGKDLFDAAKTAESAIGGSLTVALKVVLESLYRSKLLAPKSFTFEVTDWAAEYRIDHTETYTMEGMTVTYRFSGTKCDGPEGEWVIDYEGTLGDIGTLDGTFFVQIPKGALSGPMGAAFRMNIPGYAAGGEGTAGGTGTFVPETPSMDIRTTGSSGTAWAFGNSMSGSDGTPRDVLSLPVEVGDFCD